MQTTIVRWEININSIRNIERECKREMCLFDAASCFQKRAFTEALRSSKPNVQLFFFAFKYHLLLSLHKVSTFAFPSYCYRYHFITVITVIYISVSLYYIDHSFIKFQWISKKNLLICRWNFFAVHEFHFFSIEISTTKAMRVLNFSCCITTTFERLSRNVHLWCGVWNCQFTIINIESW